VICFTLPEIFVRRGLAPRFAVPEYQRWRGGLAQRDAGKSPDNGMGVSRSPLGHGESDRTGPPACFGRALSVPTQQRRTRRPSNECVFCRVASGEIRSTIIYEDAAVIGFRIAIGSISSSVRSKGWKQPHCA
jgi:hypothetical protein